MAGLLQQLGIGGPAKPDHNGILGAFSDSTATRMQIAGQILSNLAWGGHPIDTAGELSNATYQGALTQKTNFDNKTAQQLRDAAARYSEKVRKSNPEFADALMADPSLINKIWESKIARENDPSYIFAQTMMPGMMPSTGLPNLSNPSQMNGSIQAPAPQEPTPYSDPRNPIPGKNVPGSNVAADSVSPASSVAALAATSANPVADVAAKDPRIVKLEQVSGIPNLTSSESSALFAGIMSGPAGFTAASNQVRDERFSRSQSEFAHQQSLAAAAQAAQAHQDQIDSQNQSRDIAKGTQNETHENNVRTAASKMTDDLYKESLFHQQLLQVGQRTAESLKDGKLSPADQIRVMYDFVKSLDPQSAVREGEVGLARQTQSYTDQLTTMIERINKGQILQPSDVEQMEKTIIGLAKQSEKKLYNINDKYKKRAKAMGIPENFIFSDPADPAGFKSSLDSSDAPAGALPPLQFK